MWVREEEEKEGNKKVMSTPEQFTCPRWQRATRSKPLLMLLMSWANMALVCHLSPKVVLLYLKSSILIMQERSWLNSPLVRCPYNLIDGPTGSQACRDSCSIHSSSTPCSPSGYCELGSPFPPPPSPMHGFLIHLFKPQDLSALITPVVLTSTNLCMGPLNKLLWSNKPWLRKTLYSLESNHRLTFQ